MSFKTKLFFIITIFVAAIFLFGDNRNNYVSAQWCGGSYSYSYTFYSCDPLIGCQSSTQWDTTTCFDDNGYCGACEHCGYNCDFSSGSCTGAVTYVCPGGPPCGTGESQPSDSCPVYPEVTNTPTPTPTSSVLCGGYASPGECHRNQDDNCYYECEDDGSWDGPFLTESGDNCLDRTWGDCWGDEPTNTPVPGDPTNTPRPPTNTPAPSARQILGIIKKKGTTESWYRSDQGACSNDFYEDISNGMNVCNTSGGCVYDWSCTAAGGTSYHTRAASTGAGPHTFIFTPPEDSTQAYDCSQVHWEYAYATCGSGCSDPRYVPPDGDGDGNPDYDVDGDGNNWGGYGCVAQLYLGPQEFDTHVHWYIDMESGGRRWINGVVLDYYPGQRYSEIPVESCTRTGPTLDCPSCDRENWICDWDGPHFDLSINTGFHSNGVEADTSGANFDTCDWLVTDRSCVDLSDIGSTSKTYDDCTADVDVPGDCDWQKGITFWMRDYCSVNLLNTSVDYPVGTTNQVIPSIDDPNPPYPDGQMIATSADATKVAICEDPLGCAVGQDTVIKDLSSEDTSFYMTIHEVGATPDILTVSYTPSKDYPCSPASADVEGTNPDPWYQIFGGSIGANKGDIYTSIPDSSILGYAAYLLNDLEDLSGNVIASQGVASAFNTAEPDPVSTNNSQAEGVTSADTGKYNFDYFYDRLGPPAQNLSSNSVVVDTLESCDMYKGYRVCYRNGSLDINYGDDDIGDNKIIVFVDGDVRINTAINLNDGIGFLMVIATGDMVIDPGIGNADPTDTSPNLEGIFVALDDFVSEADVSGSDLHLRIRGAVVGLNSDDDALDHQGVSLNRTLENNTEGPAEAVDSAPDQILRFPPFLGEKYVFWQEVAP